MSYISTLSAKQKQNIQYLVDAMEEAGITNPISQASILAIISKESSFEPQNENMNYSADRIRQVFGLSSTEANQFAHKPEALANRVYGGKYGNNSSGDGWKYRGRGYNGITFKGNYKKYGEQIGEDIVSNPEKANDPKIAGKIAVAFAKNGIGALRSAGKLASYNAKDTNDFKTTKDGVMAFYHINAGTGKSVSYIKGLTTHDSLGGMTKALSRVDELLQYVKSEVKKKSNNFLINGILIGLLLASGWVVYRKYNKQAI